MSVGVALVTGAAGGLGQAFCQQLVTRGYFVWATDQHMARLEVCQKTAPDQIEIRMLDVTQRDDFFSVLSEVLERHTRIDLLINCAGIVDFGQAWSAVWETNFMGTLHGCQVVGQQMLSQNDGLIINVSSLAGLVPMMSVPSYTASKHAVVGLSYALSMEWANTGVDIVVACPGYVNTELEENSATQRAVQFRPFWLRPISALTCAKIVLNRAFKGQKTIVLPLHAKIIWMIYRLSPRIWQKMSSIWRRKQTE